MVEIGNLMLEPFHSRFMYYQSLRQTDGVVVCPNTDLLRGSLPSIFIIAAIGDHTIHRFFPLRFISESHEGAHVFSAAARFQKAKVAARPSSQQAGAVVGFRLASPRR